MKTLNVVVVRYDATTVSFQADSWSDAGEQLTELSRDTRSYYVRPSDPVFVFEVGKTREQHTVQGLCDAFRRGELSQ